MIDTTEFSRFILLPVLDVIGVEGSNQYDSAIELLLGTALVESGLNHLRFGASDRLGVFGMTRPRHDQTWDRLKKFQPKLANRVESIGGAPAALTMVGNLWYAAAMCRAFYLLANAPLPAQGDYEAQAAFWKEHYDTFEGPGTEEEYLGAWEAYAKGV